MQGANIILGPIWIWSYMLTAVLILLNFLVAILCEVYAEVCARLELTFLYTKSLRMHATLGQVYTALPALTGGANLLTQSP